MSLPLRVLIVWVVIIWVIACVVVMADLGGPRDPRRKAPAPETPEEEERAA